MLMLPREMLKLNNRQVDLVTGLPINNKVFDDLSVDQASGFARMMTYLQGVEKSLPEAKTDPSSFAPLAEEPRPQDIEAEIASLPDRQILLKYREFVVCFASQQQLPATVHEIARQRERTFRLHDEGSGEPIDTDGFDASYVQLFIWDTQRHALMGAYRMGRTDELRKSGGVYLSEMFDFDDAFYADHPASLEMGRSFVTPEYQKNYYSLHLLWRGIGAYLRLHPQYRRLYGTVSLSRQYDLRSICVMCDALIEPIESVTPRWSLDTDLGPEWANYRDRAGTVKLDQVSAIVRSLEKDGKDIPILLRHYYKLDAKFLAVGVDPNFNHTPGLLLSVSIDDLPEKKRKSYIFPPSRD
jgi:putative hemolysin